MICPRCSGFVLAQYDEVRCIPCGWRHNEPYAETIREPYWRKTCRNCKNKPAPEKTYCQSCLDYMVNYKRTRGKVGA